MSDPRGGKEERRQSRAVFPAPARFVIGALFFCVLTPVALVMRLFGRDRLRLRLDRAAPSYWVARTLADGRQNSMTGQF